MKTKQELIAQLTEEQRINIRTKLESMLYLMNSIECDSIYVEDSDEFRHMFFDPDPSYSTLWCQLYNIKELLS